MARDFFGVYLLASQALTAKGRSNGRTYIGFTVNPRRRIRQHNGEINSGAWRTKACALNFRRGIGSLLKSAN